MYWSAFLPPFASTAASPVPRASIMCLDMNKFRLVPSILIIARCVSDTSSHIRSPPGSQVEKLALPANVPSVTLHAVPVNDWMRPSFSLIPSFSQVPGRPTGPPSRFQCVVSSCPKIPVGAMRTPTKPQPMRPWLALSFCRLKRHYQRSACLHGPCMSPMPHCCMGQALELALLDHDVRLGRLTEVHEMRVHHVLSSGSQMLPPFLSKYTQVFCSLSVNDQSLSSICL